MRKVIVFESKGNPGHFLEAIPGRGDVPLKNVDIKTTMMMYHPEQDATIHFVEGWIENWEKHTERAKKMFGDDYIPFFDWENVLQNYNITMIEVEQSKLSEEK